jgi:hypothetical protein
MARNDDPTDLAGQQLDKREAEERRRIARAREIADLKWLMRSPRGRRLMWRFMTMSRTFQLSFSPNAMQMAFNEGNRNLGLQLLDEVMTLCPELFPVMQKEHQDDGKRNGTGDNHTNS